MNAQFHFSFRRCSRLLVLVALLGLFAETGCARRWRMTLSGGAIIDTKGKPKLTQDKSAYEYKDVRGQRGSVPAFRVQELAPR